MSAVVGYETMVRSHEIEPHVRHRLKDFAKRLDNQVAAFVTVKSSDEEYPLGIAPCQLPRRAGSTG